VPSSLLRQIPDGSPDLVTALDRELPAIRPKIVASDGGRIQADSEGEGKGATFVSSLPALEEDH
jgi:hypothetical protein